MSSAPLSPRVVQALQLLGAGRADEAERIANDLIKEQPGHAGGWGVQAEVLARSPERKGQAWAAYSKALSLQPDWLALRCNLAALLRGMGRHQEAREECLAVLQVDPSHAMARLSLAEAALLLGRNDEACAELEELTTRRPGFAPGWIQLSWLRLRRREVDAAVDAARRAVEADGRSAMAHSRLAEALCDSGKAEEARAHFKSAVALAPDKSALRGRHLLLLSYLPGLPLAELVGAHKEEGARLAAEASPALPRPVAQPAADGRVRVGYVSADLLQHSVAVFFKPALLAHDRSKVALYAYYSQPMPREGAALSGHFDQWRPCAAMSDAELAAQIRADNIDVLVDLSGHTAHHRLGVFARKPARLHWQWFGYPLLTGVEAFDARLTDVWMDPPGQNPAGEKLLHLPSRLVWGPDDEYPPVAGTPHLGGQPFTFGSFNGLRKVNAGLLDSWAAILRAVPGSRLRMGHMDSASFEKEFRERLQAAGVDGNRLEVLPTMVMGDYLKAHDGIDLMLDSFPYNGGTTTMLGLWQGVPLLTLAGRYGSHRLTASILLQLGMEELVADSVDDYVARAVALAGQPAKLQAWRAGMRRRILDAPLGQPRAVVGALESLMAQALGRP
jgi:protein O-GlcNAc transferase